MNRSLNGRPAPFLSHTMALLPRCRDFPTNLAAALFLFVRISFNLPFKRCDLFLYAFLYCPLTFLLFPPPFLAVPRECLLVYSFPPLFYLCPSIIAPNSSLTPPNSPYFPPPSFILFPRELFLQCFLCVPLRWRSSHARHTSSLRLSARVLRPVAPPPGVFFSPSHNLLLQLFYVYPEGALTYDPSESGTRYSDTTLPSLIPPLASLRNSLRNRPN